MNSSPASKATGSARREINSSSGIWRPCPRGGGPVPPSRWSGWGTRRPRGPCSAPHPTPPSYTIAQPGNEKVQSVNAVVGETNDGGLNDIRGLHVTREHVVDAIRSSKSPVGMTTRIIAIDGPGGAGKSSLAEHLAHELDAPIVHTDDFASWDNPIEWWPDVIEKVRVVIGERARGVAQVATNLPRFEQELSIQEANITEPGEEEATRALRVRWTDFIFAVIAEELGFVGAVLVLVLIGLLLWRIMRAASLAQDPLGALIC